MKRKTAREILTDSFRELARTKKVDKITIRDITDNCGYSPATFYRQFKDKYDLIAWDYTRSIAEIMDQTGVDGFPWEQTLIDGANFFHEQQDYLANLFHHTSGHDSFIRYMIEINYNALKKHIVGSVGDAELDEKTDMNIRIYCLGTVNLTCEWILGKYHATPETLAGVFRDSIPEPLRPYLLK